SRSDMERAGARLVQVPGVSGKQYESPDPDAGWKPDVANMLRIQADMASMRTCVQDVGMAQQLAYHDALVSELRTDQAATRQLHRTYYALMGCTCVLRDTPTTAPAGPTTRAPGGAHPPVAAGAQAAGQRQVSVDALLAAGWRNQGYVDLDRGGNLTRWANSTYGSVLLSQDGWLTLPNNQKVRPERVGLYLQGLAQGTATLPKP